LIRNGLNRGFNVDGLMFSRSVDFNGAIGCVIQCLSSFHHARLAKIAPPKARDCQSLTMKQMSVGRSPFEPPIMGQAEPTATMR
jgi:hypothetical protein